MDEPRPRVDARHHLLLVSYLSRLSDDPILHDPRGWPQRLASAVHYVLLVGLRLAQSLQELLSKVWHHVLSEAIERGHDLAVIEPTKIDE